ncbi:MAG TPA: GNAT family protein [Acidimicrobiales bacterium]
MADDADLLPAVIDVGSLTLRRPQLSDAEAIAAAIALSKLELRPWMPWLRDHVADPGFQRDRFLEVEAQWGRPGGEAAYLIERPEVAGIVGFCGIQHRHQPDTRQLGFWVRSDLTSRGHVTTAARALTAEALRLPGVVRVEIHCDEANVRSAAVARRCGYRLDRLEPHAVEAPGHTGTFMIWATTPGWAA